MNEQYNYIQEEFRHVLGLSNEERISFMDHPRWIGYDGAVSIIDTLQGLMHKPKRTRMPNLLLVGEPNNGKTTILERFYELCGKGYVNDDCEPVKPLILAESPTTADEKELYIAILERFFTPYRASDSKAKLRYQVIQLFRECHVNMLIIDEMHSLLTGTMRMQREVMNAIKLLCNELKIPIVGCGTRDAIQVLQTDPQHASRFTVISLPLWELNPKFQKLLKSFETVLPLKKESRLFEANKATLLHSISQGNLGNLHRLLVECARNAIDSGTEEITIEIIKSNAWLTPTTGITELRL